MTDQKANLKSDATLDLGITEHHWNGLKRDVYTKRGRKYYGLYTNHQFFRKTSPLYNNKQNLNQIIKRNLAFLDDRREDTEYQNYNKKHNIERKCERTGLR